jgi:hypothetical protein
MQLADRFPKKKHIVKKKNKPRSLALEIDSP